MKAHRPADPELSRLVILLTHPQGQAAFAIMALSALVVFNAFFYLYSPYTGMEVFRENPFGQIDVVYPGGPADVAGVQPGDQLVAIDGRTLDPARSGPRYRRGLAPGEIVVHTVQRGGERLDLPIAVGSYRDNLPVLGSYLGLQVLSVGLWGIGLLLSLFVPPADRRARLLGLGFLLAGVTAAAGGASGWNSFWGANALQLVLMSFSGAVLVAAHLTFPAVRLPRARRALINMFGAAALMLSALVALESWLPGAEIWAPLDPRRVVLVYFILAWLIALGLLLANRIRAPEPEVRRQTGIVLWGLALGIGPFFALTLLPFLMFGAEYVAGYYSILFLLLLPLSYAYVIFQRRLLRVDFIINRLVVFFVLLLAILILSILLFGALVLALDLPNGLPLLGGLVAALIALPSAGLHRQIQVRVNQVLYGGHYDFPSVTASLSSQLAQTLDRDTLISLLTDGLSRQMAIAESALLLRQGSRLAAAGEAGTAFSTALEDELCKVLGDAGTPLRAPRLWGLLSAETQERWGSFAWGQVFAPMLFEGRLHGLLVLGPRAAGDVYSDQDLRIIATVAHQGALASANVGLVEELRGLASQLVRADESQRKRLARELHDAVLQDLFFLKQRLPRGADSAEATALLEDVIGKLRGLIKAQRPALLDQGLVLALQGLVEDMQRVVGPSPELAWQCSCEPTLALPDEWATSIFRIAQEALINALKHAQAGRVVVELDHRPNGTVRLCVADDGRGWPGEGEAASAANGHFGLVGMRERARMIGGELEVGPHPGGGTAVVLEFSL